MRDAKHYLKLIKSSETVGANLFARALAAAGDEREARIIARELDDATLAEAAVSKIAGTALVAASEMDEPGAYIRQVREGMGWTRKEMGARLGLPVQGYKCRTLANWERGNRTPDWAGRKALRGLGRELKDEL